MEILERLIPALEVEDSNLAFLGEPLWVRLIQTWFLSSVFPIMSLLQSFSL